MITGSTAANFYAVPRMTRDIDIVVELSERDVEKFIDAFKKDHYLEPATVRAAVKTKGMFNLIHDKYILKVDFVVRKDTPFRRREFARKKKISVDGQYLSVVAPEDLILSKLVWAKDSNSEFQCGTCETFCNPYGDLTDATLPDGRNSWVWMAFIGRRRNEGHLGCDGAKVS